MQHIVYEILNTVNNHKYVGSTSHFDKRKLRHLRDLLTQKHHSIYLQRAVNKYGINNFIFNILKIYETCDDMKSAEQQLLNDGIGEYNISRNASGGDNITNHPLYTAICNKQKLIYEQKKAANGGVHPNLQLFISQPGNLNTNWKGGTSKHKCIDCDSEIPSIGIRCGICNKLWLKTIRLGKGNHFYGKHHNEKTKQKLRESRLGVKPTNMRKVDVSTIIYNSCTSAAAALNISIPLLLYRIKSTKYNDYKYYLEGSTTSLNT
jgi:group I intron endonuclease